MTIEEAKKTDYRYAIIEKNSKSVLAVTDYIEDYKHFTENSARNVDVVDLKGDNNG